jgi:hypothetical protein
MPPLKVEYAKTARARCQLKECGDFLAKGELRIGTGNLMPGATELSYKFRHVPCFTKRQLANAPSVDHIEGYDDLMEEHQAVIRNMLKGAYAGDMSKRGVFVNPKMAEDASAKKPKKAKAAARDVGGDDDDEEDVDDDGGAAAEASPAKKRRALPKTRAGAAASLWAAAGIGMAAPGGAAGARRPRHEEGVDDEDDDGEPVPGARAAAAADLLPCPHGAACYRTNPEHFKEYSHPGRGAPAAAAATFPAAPVANKPAAPASPPPRPMGQRTLDGRIIAPAPAVGAAAAGAVAGDDAGAEERVDVPGLWTPALPPTADGRKRCRFGDLCFRTDPSHFSELAH